MNRAEPTVLIVDDEAEFREVMAQYLEACGYRVLEGADGLDALALIEQVRPQAVVIDLAMPRLGGLEALTQIREVDPGLRMVVVTGQRDPRLLRRAAAMGAAVLTKPFGLDRLLAALGGSPPSEEAGTLRREPGSRGVSVLVVAGEEGMGPLLDDVLARDGYGVERVADESAAVDAIAASRPALILLDLDVLPEERGRTALGVIQSRARGIPLVVISGPSSGDLAKRALASGALDFVTKPIDIPWLLGVIDRAVGSRR